MPLTQTRVNPLEDPNYGYIYRDIMKIIGDDDVKAYEVAEKIPMALTEVMGWLEDLVTGKVLSCVKQSDGFNHYKKIE